MKNKILLLISIIVTLLFLVSCAPKMSDEELEAELSTLSPEELEAVTAKDSGAFAGMAKANPKLIRLQRSYRKVVATNPPKCTDTDEDLQFSPASRNPLQKGTITWTLGSSFGGPVDDVCADENLLRENFCKDGVRYAEPINCDMLGVAATNKPQEGSGLKCIDGACKKQEPADLIVESADFSLVLNATTGKDDVKYTAVVKNIGLGDAGSFANKFYVILGSGVPTVNHHLGSAALPAGSSVTLTGKYSPYDSSDLSKTVCPGTHTLNITADYTNTVAESDETNNGKQLTVTC